MKVLITGAAGYVGSRLVPALLDAGHEVTGYDVCWFGQAHWPHDREGARLIQADIRDIGAFRAAVVGQEVVIHLACVSNDHSCQLDEALSTSINYDAFEPLVVAAKELGVRRFIYCSSSSVYGVSDAPAVTEEHPLVPLTLYNRYKGLCEPLLFKHQSEDFTTVAIRPATVCGWAPRMRFDLTVNILTAHAVLNRRITVFGGSQRRPNLHIEDMVRCYKALIDAPASRIAGQVFNVGKENWTVMQLALMVQRVVGAAMGIHAVIDPQPSTDQRSYHIDSTKIRDVLGFVPLYKVEDAISEMCQTFGDGHWQDALSNPVYTNVKQLVDLGHAVSDSLASFRADRYAPKVAGG